MDFFFCIQATSHLEEYNEMLEFILKWIEKANILVHGSITWNSSSQLRDQFKAYQVIILATAFNKSVLKILIFILYTFSFLSLRKKKCKNIMLLWLAVQVLRMIDFFCIIVLKTEIRIPCWIKLHVSSNLCVYSSTLASWELLIEHFV